MPKILLPFIILFSVFFFNACDNSSNSLTNRNCEVDTTATHSSRINDDMIRFHPNSQVKTIQNKETIITYNGLYNINALQFLNLETGGATIKNISLPSEGIDAISQVTSFYYHNADSIFVISMFHIGIVNSKGKVLMKQPINRDNIKIQGINFSEKAIIADYNCPLYYDAKDNSLYVSIRNNSFDILQDGFYEGSIAGKLHLSDMSFQELPLYYPENFKIERYGTLRTPNITFLNDRIVYNFQYASTVYVYDKKSNKTSKFNCLVDHANNEAQPLKMDGFDEDAIKKYSAMNSLFFRMLYDHYNDIWYRTHFSQSYAEQNGLFGKNESFLTIWDNKFNKIKELKLSQNLNPLAIFPTKDALFIFNVESNVENIVIFKKYRISCNE